MTICGFNACNQVDTTNNPFFSEWDTPFGIPPFNKIYAEHFIPAIKEGLKKEKKEIDNIVNSSEEPTFDNVIIPYTTTGEFLSRTLSVFNNLCSAQATDSLKKIQSTISPMLTTHNNDIKLNEKLFDKIKIVYNKRNEFNLDDEQMRLLEKVYKDFMRNGARLNDVDKKVLRQYDEQLSKLSLDFGNNLLNEMNSFKMVIKNSEDLAGLPNDVIEAASEAAKKERLEGSWVFTLDKPSMIPFLQYAHNRTLRKKLYEGYLNRCNNDDDKDNKENVNDIVNLRFKRAYILAYPSHAYYVLEQTMAKKEKNVYNMLGELWLGAIALAESEKAELIAIKEKDGIKDDFQPWDWWYYAEKLRKEKYDLDEEMIKPYMSLESVRNGIFTLVDTLYGVKFRAIDNAPKYNDECQTYEVLDVDGSHLGVIIMDFHPRKGKRVGAWCSSFRPQKYRDGKRIAPISTIVCNFTRPTSSTPALLNLDEVETFFHEFGHAMHTLLSDVKYDGLRGVSRDFVELPSQIMENWSMEPQMLKLYAKHYETGEVIPDDLVKKISNSKFFNQGFNTVEYLAAAMLDMDYHVISDTTTIDIVDFEKQSLTDRFVPIEIAPRYRSTYFQHIFSGGYSAGYYSYIWSEMLDADAYQAFVETGNIFDKDMATKFRKTILERGGSQDELEMYHKFRGRDAKIKYLMLNRGFILETPIKNNIY